MPSTLKYKKISSKAKSPVRATPYSAGYDVFSAETANIDPWGRKLVSLDISIDFLEDRYARLAPRSGLALKGLDVGAGVVDYDYTGNIGVVLFNFSSEVFNINEGDKIGQIILTKIITPPVEEVDKICKETKRGDKGFGSTG